MIDWGALGIKPTTERIDIRRAYAKKVKECHPEEDPKGFQHLRETYEQALKYAFNAAKREQIKPIIWEENEKGSSDDSQNKYQDGSNYQDVNEHQDGKKYQDKSEYQSSDKHYDESKYQDENKHQNDNEDINVNNYEEENQEYEDTWAANEEDNYEKDDYEKDDYEKDNYEEDDYEANDYKEDGYDEDFVYERSSLNFKINRKKRLSAQTSNSPYKLAEKVMECLRELYHDKAKRNDKNEWEKLLEDDALWNYDVKKIVASRLFDFLDINREMPHGILLLLNKFFGWKQEERELIDYFFSEDEIIAKAQKNGNTIMEIIAAKLLYSRAFAVWQSGQPKKAKVLYEEMIEKFGFSRNIEINIIIARTFLNLAICMERSKVAAYEIVLVYDEMIKRFLNSNDMEIAVELVEGMFKKAYCLSQLNSYGAALNAYEMLLNRFEKIDEKSGIISYKITAFYNRAVTLNVLGRKNEAIYAFNQFFDYCNKHNIHDEETNKLRASAQRTVYKLHSTSNYNYKLRRIIAYGFAILCLAQIVYFIWRDVLGFIK